MKKDPIPHDHYSHALRENKDIEARRQAERPVKCLAGTTRRLSKEDMKMCKELSEHIGLLEPRHMCFPAEGLQVSSEKELDEALANHRYLMNAMPRETARS